jgi:hypothetical protein
MCILHCAEHVIRRSSTDTQECSIEARKPVFLTRSDRPIKSLACPARFERATYALEA